MRYNIRLFSIFCLLIVLAACQTNPDKPQENNETGANLPSTDLDWVSLQASVEEQLQAREFGLAQITIERMVEAAGDVLGRWDYLRSALISLPYDISKPTVERISSLPVLRNNADQAYGMSKVFMHYKMYDEAIEWSSRAIDLEDRAKFYFWRARIYAINDNNDASESDFKKLIAREPDNLEYQVQYASLLQQKGDYAAAQQLLSEQEPSFWNGYKRIIFALQAEDMPLAESLYQELRNGSYDAAEADEYFQLGEVAYWLDKTEESIALLEQVGSGNNFFEARLLLARVLVQSQQPERALVILRQIQSASAEYAINAYLIESSIHQNEAQYDRASTVLNQALQLFKDDQQLLYARAMLAESQDDLASMEKDLMHILKLSPDNANAMNALGYSWANRSLRLQEAKQYIEKAYELDPKNAPIIDSMGWVYYRLGDLDKAEKYLRMAIELGPADAEIYLHIIEVLDVKGETGKAQEFRQKARELFPDRDF
ncbi:tetratricopeptide repeat protein [Marinicella sp. W31]|uniref:tetratricopeptide repeat protein n=1 Tax=Marinicella sp. W31 TaxID=3023713 RepID=UPI0037575497